jgi:hypothetical protein
VRTSLAKFGNSIKNLKIESGQKKRLLSNKTSLFGKLAGVRLVTY